MKFTIVGGGFGGAKTALELAKDGRNHITVISDKPDFQYYPALYSAATGDSHLKSWVPLSEIFAGKKNIELKLDTIVTLDPDEHVVTAKSGKKYEYETLILALGTVTTFFGIKGLDTYAYGIKSAVEIEKLKQHLYDTMARDQTAHNHYIIVGAGPTGVELAAALGSYLERIRDHYSLDKRMVHIDLIEAAPRILPKMHEKTSRKAQKHLERLGINVETGKAVEEAKANSIIVSGSAINSQTVIWTSGVANHPFFKANAEHFTLAPNGRVTVDNHMLAAEDVYVIGDNAATQFTGLAQTALHDALFVAKNFKRIQNHQKPLEYKAVMPPVVVPVGEYWAVFEWRKLRAYGWIASIIRRAADFLGYSDILPLGQALGVWRAKRVISNDPDVHKK